MTLCQVDNYALIELAGLANLSEARPPAAPRNLSDEPPGRAPPASFATSDQFPLYFVGNQGQVDNDQVSHYVQGRDRTIYFTPGGLTFVLVGGGGPTAGARAHEPGRHTPTSSLPAEPLRTSRWVVKLDFLDSNSRAQPTGQQRTSAVVSYFKGQRGTGLRISPPSRSLSIPISGLESASFIPVRFSG